jgi:hypothetical protein
MFVPLLLETPKRALGHCTKPKFSREGTRSLHKTKLFPQKRHSFIAQISPENSLVHCTKPKIYFFATRKDVESSQMPGKRILAL